MTSNRLWLLGPTALVLNACIQTKMPASQTGTVSGSEATIRTSPAPTQSINLIPLADAAEKPALPTTETRQNALQPYRTTVYVVQPNAQVHTSHDRYSKILCKVDKNDPITVDDHIATKTLENDWYRTNICGKHGWISGQALTLNPLVKSAVN
ncbi:hypothetical protein IQ266_20370 [filamentous cyanobacterium LEGE 11480]|uniref:SH3 domain-containing protein n=1 Tax=Romeriopsis navalis LEGE 11480 TaxID=2777977 RepID=A0A928VQW4_9CYAN|nr:hypothetical protein [Romeriopsis navalis]MBE9032097.1 hypothetical protein [Romeriopsis navalis LEGE 11480]